MKQTIVAFFLVFCFSAIVLASQPPARAEELYYFTVMVKDMSAQHNLIPNAAVNVNGTIQNTNASGMAQFMLLPGFYDVTITKAGFKNFHYSLAMPVWDFSYLAHLTAEGGGSGSTYSITVQVNDEDSNDPIGNAAVVLAGVGGDPSAAIQYTNPIGTAMFTGKPAATYTVTTSHLGYETAEQTITVSNSDKTVSFLLSPTSSGGNETQDGDATNGTPGFEIATLAVAIGIALVVISKNKPKGGKPRE